LNNNFIKKEVLQQMKMIYTGETKLYRKKTQYKVRMMGFEVWLKEAEFLKAVKDGHVFRKANKPFTEKDLKAA